MDGRHSPADAAESGLPADVFINPDNLPPPSPLQLDTNDPVILPSQSPTGKISKLKGLFKKDKAKEKEPSRVSELGDVLGKSTASSTGSKYDESDEAPVLRHTEKKAKPSQLASFRDFFSKKPAHDDTLEQTVNAAGPQATSYQKSTQASLQNFFRGSPVLVIPQPTEEVQIAPLNEPLPSSPYGISVFMFVLYGLILVVGTILLIVGLTGNSRKAEHCLVLGPIFLVLGAFVMIGHVFFVLFWTENPLPCLNDCMAKVNSKIGGVEDPYGLKEPDTYTIQRTSYHPGFRLSSYMPPASPTAKETIPMSYLPSTAYEPERVVRSTSHDASWYAQNVSYRSYDNTSYQDERHTADNVI